MITAMQSYLRQWRHTLRRLRVDPRVHTAVRVCGYLLGGFLLSAASLGNRPQPLALGLVCASAGWPAALMAIGGSAGYLLFWSSAGLQGALWMSGGLLAALLVGHRQITKAAPLLLPAAAGLVVAVSGLAFQRVLGDTTPVTMYLLRILLGGASTRLFVLVDQRRDPIADWLACGICVLALAQVVPFPYLGLGFLAAGVLGTAGAFPAAALGGLALDLAQVTSMPMTAVVCLAYFVRLIPRAKKWLIGSAPGIVYLCVMGLVGKWDLYPLPGLVLGGLVGLFLPGQAHPAPRRGETGIAQVRLEMVAGVFSQAQQLLLEATDIPLDEEALIQRAANRACGSCPCRKSCRERDNAAKMPPLLLHRPLLDGNDLPILCRKEGRLLQELHRSQEQLRTLHADRERQKEYRSAVIQQYQFLSEYLQDLSDELSKRIPRTRPRYKAQVAFCANRPEADNGDRCLSFAGVGCRHFVALCDGMGTGLGAVDEGSTAGMVLKKLLTAGYPAEYALRSLNSLCALRGRAGAVTVDLAELQLDSGKVLLYKWGAAPSFLLTKAGTEKIGTATPPPGLSVTDSRETVERLSLRQGQTLLLLSDGVGGEDALRCCFATPDEPLGELAARILEFGDPESADDATVAAIRLSLDSSST
ncbi:MAG: SpoIIE family protein phosphatase [Oscillospiraceae bacterium]|nr:SpoIIE family protein phosphatase [Oscillospiraceae bacterium]